MQKSDCIIGVEHVSKFFGDKAVLNDVNLSVRKGEFVTILGPSGYGKTTLLRLIAGFQTASEGVITIAGKDITQTPPHKRPVNTVFQKYALFPHLNVFNNIAFGLKLKKLPGATIEKKVKQALRMVGMTDYEDRDVDSLSGGQQQRVAIARAIVNEPEVLLLDEPLAALDLKMRKDMQMELKEMHQKLGITFVYVTHDQEEALTLSDTIVVMSEGRIQQIGVPTDIYNEPINSFVADFIGESNILNGVMIKDKAVTFCGHEFECVDTGFGEQMQVDVVIRPEDIYIFDVSDAAQLTGTVTSCIFKGVHYEMLVQTREGYELMVQDYHAFEAGREVGLLVKPFDIHVMKKERTCNTFEGKLVDETHVDFLGCNFECLPVQGIEPGSAVQVEVDFQHVILEDNEEDGRLTGEVKFILYKGNHYHLTVFTDWDEDIFVDTNDVWDDGDRVGITIAPQNIRIVQSLNKEGSAQYLIPFLHAPAQLDGTLRAVSACICHSTAAAHRALCLYGRRRGVYVGQLPQVHDAPRSDEHVCLLHRNSRYHHAGLPAAGLSGSVYPEPEAIQHLTHHGGAVHPPHVGEYLDTYACHSGAVRLPEPAAGRRCPCVRYGLQLPAVHDIPHLQHSSEDGPQSD